MPSLSNPRPKSLLFALLILSTSLTYLATSTVQTIQFSHNHFHYGAKLTPHPDKVEKGGEDAFFANNRVLAVADGVGGWTLQGIDPSKYSKALCHNVGVLLNEQSDLYSNNPKLIIAEAARRDPHEGSSTFVVVTIDKEQPVLRTSYIGDSLYVIYRKIDGKWGIVFEAEEQQKAFNFPFQLGNNGGDPPQTAREFRHDVEDKDIVVVASDGLFDNLTADQVLKQLLPYIDEEGEVKAPQAAAERLAKAAYDLSLDKNYDSPFAQRAFQARLLFNGGKSDDITVIVGQVKLVKSEEELERERLVEEVIRESQKKSESLESTEGGESPERQKVQDNDL